MMPDDATPPPVAPPALALADRADPPAAPAETPPPPAPRPLPSVTPEDAAKVLAADTRNAIRGVSEGGTLQAPHRKLMQGIAVTHQAARAARVAALVQRWMNGNDLSVEQRAEILAEHADFIFAPAAASETTMDSPRATPETTLPADDSADVTIAEAAVLYGTKRRALFRWLALGRSKTPPDPCPLAHPAKMPAWWTRNMKHTLPDKIAAAAARAAPAKVEQVDDPAKTPSASETIVEITGSTPTLASTELIEGEAVKQARQIVGMCFEQLRKALESRPPNIEDAARWQVRWEKSQEALRKQERDERETRKQNGDLLPRSAVLTEIAQLIEALRLAHMSMGRKILAELGRQATGRTRRVLTLIEPALIAAVETVRAKETDLFQHVEGVTSPAIAVESLAA